MPAGCRVAPKRYRPGAPKNRPCPFPGNRLKQVLLARPTLERRSLCTPSGQCRPGCRPGCPLARCARASDDRQFSTNNLAGVGMDRWYGTSGRTDRSGRPSSASPGWWRLMSDETEIRPFRLDTPDEAIADLRRRIAATRWAARELVADRSQGVSSRNGRISVSSDISLHHPGLVGEGRPDRSVRPDVPGQRPIPAPAR